MPEAYDPTQDPQFAGSFAPAKNAAKPYDPTQDPQFKGVLGKPAVTLDSAKETYYTKKQPVSFEEAALLREDDEKRGLINSVQGGVGPALEYAVTLGKDVGKGALAVGEKLYDAGKEALLNPLRLLNPLTFTEGGARGTYDTFDLARRIYNKSGDYLKDSTLGGLKQGATREEKIQHYMDRLNSNLAYAAQGEQQQLPQAVTQAVPAALRPNETMAEGLREVADPITIASLGAGAIPKLGARVLAKVAAKAPALARAAEVAGKVMAVPGQVADATVGRAARALPGAIEQTAGALKTVTKMPESLVKLLPGPAQTPMAAIGGSAATYAGLMPYYLGLKGAHGTLAGVEKAAEFTRRLLATEGGRNLPRLVALGRAADAPEWIKTTARTMHRLGLGTAGEVAGTAAKGAAHGMVAGAGLGVLSSESSEELGQAIGSGGALGAGGRVAGRYSPRGQREAREMKHSLDTLDLVDHLLDTGHSEETIKRLNGEAAREIVGVLANYRAVADPALQVRLLAGPDYAAATPDAPNSGGHYDEVEGQRRVTVNLDATSKAALHEVGHALEKAAGSLPEARAAIVNLLGPEGVAEARNRYATRLVEDNLNEGEVATPEQVAAQLAERDAAIGGDWIYREIFADASKYALRRDIVRDVLDPSLWRKLQLAYKDPSKVPDGTVPEGALFEDPRIYGGDLRKLVYDHLQALYDEGPNTPKLKEGKDGLPGGTKLNPRSAGAHAGVPESAKEIRGSVMTAKSKGQIAKEERARDKEAKAEFIDRPAVVPPSPQPSPPGEGAGKTPPATPLAPDDIQQRTRLDGTVEHSGTRISNRLVGLKQFSDQAKAVAAQVEALIQSASGGVLRTWYFKPDNIEVQQIDISPYDFHVSQKGNVLVRGVGVTALQRKVGEWQNQPGSLLHTTWGGDVGAMLTDLDTYLQNHRADLPGDANGLGAAKKNALNFFVVGRHVTLQAFNPWRATAAAGDKSIIRELRLDRMANPEGAPGSFPVDWDKAAHNLSPGGGRAAGEQGSRGAETDFEAGEALKPGGPVLYAPGGRRANPQEEFYRVRDRLRTTHGPDEASWPASARNRLEDADSALYQALRAERAALRSQRADPSGDRPATESVAPGQAQRADDAAAVARGSLRASPFPTTREALANKARVVARAGVEPEVPNPEPFVPDPAPGDAGRGAQYAVRNIGLEHWQILDPAGDAFGARYATEEAANRALQEVRRRIEALPPPQETTAPTENAASPGTSPGEALQTRRSEAWASYDNYRGALIGEHGGSRHWPKGATSRLRKLRGAYENLTQQLTALENPGGFAAAAQEPAPPATSPAASDVETDRAIVREANVADSSRSPAVQYVRLIGETQTAHGMNRAKWPPEVLQRLDSLREQARVAGEERQAAARRDSEAMSRPAPTAPRYEVRKVAADMNSSWAARPDDAWFIHEAGKKEPISGPILREETANARAKWMNESKERTRPAPQPEPLRLPPRADAPPPRATTSLWYWDEKGQGHLIDPEQHAYLDGPKLRLAEFWHELGKDEELAAYPLSKSTDPSEIARDLSVGQRVTLRAEEESSGNNSGELSFGRERDGDVIDDPDYITERAGEYRDDIFKELEDAARKDAEAELRQEDKEGPRRFFDGQGRPRRARGRAEEFEAAVQERSEKLAEDRDLETKADDEAREEAESEYNDDPPRAWSDSDHSYTIRYDGQGGEYRVTSPRGRSVGNGHSSFDDAVDAATSHARDDGLLDSGSDQIRIISSNGHSLTISDAQGSPHIDATDSDPGGGGAQRYKAAWLWANNNDTTLHGGGLSPINTKRRTSNMASMAVQLGNTDFATPGPGQRLNWKPGDHWHNIEELLKAEAKYVVAEVPNIARLQFDLATGKFKTSEGQTLSADAANQRLKQWIDAAHVANPGEVATGLATAKRALVTRAALSALERPEMAGSLGKFAAGRAGEVLSKKAALGGAILYSPGGRERPPHPSPLPPPRAERGKTGSPRLYTYGGRKAAGYNEAEQRGETFTGEHDHQDRFEMDDSKARILHRDSAGWSKLWSGETVRLPQLMKHDELYRNYPDLKKMQVNSGKIGYGTALAQYDPLTDTITLGPQFVNRYVAQGAEGDRAELRNLLLHEVQHKLQTIENFAGGNNIDGAGLANANSVKQAIKIADEMAAARKAGASAASLARQRAAINEHLKWVNMSYSPEKIAFLRDGLSTGKGELVQSVRQLLGDQKWEAFARRRYLAAAGEIESRDVEARADFTKEQRRATPPYSSEQNTLVDRADNPKAARHFSPGGKPFGIGAASVNIAEGLDLPQAMKLVRGAEQARYRSVVRGIMDQAGVVAKVKSAVGDWQDGAEHSVLMQVESAPSVEAWRKAIAEAGAAGHQKSVLSFQFDPEGTGAAYEMVIPSSQASLAQVRAVLTEHGVESRTFLPMPEATHITIIDLKGTLADSIRQIEHVYGIQAKFYHGTGEYIGGETRAAGAAAYRRAGAQAGGGAR